MQLRNYTRLPWSNQVCFFFLLMIGYILISIATATNVGGGGGLNQLISGVIILFTGICLIKDDRLCTMPVYKASICLLLFIIIRQTVFLGCDSTLALASIRSMFTVLFWLVPLAFSIKCFNRTDVKSATYAIQLLVVITVLYLVYSLYIQRTYMTAEDLLGAVNTAGSAYMLIPLIWLVFKGKSRIVLYLICFLICTFSLKRQGVLGFALMSIFILYDVYRAYFRSFKFLGFLLLIIVAFYGVEIFNELFGGIIERQAHFEEVGRAVDSGRSLLRTYAMEGFVKADVMQQFFGGGAGTAARYIELRLGFYNAPHCGFIEILCDYGVLGFLLFVNLFYSIFKYARSFSRSSITWKLLFGILSTWVFSNLISHAGRVWAIYYAIAIGYVYTYFDFYRILDDKQIKD